MREFGFPDIVMAHRSSSGMRGCYRERLGGRDSRCGAEHVVIIDDGSMEDDDSGITREIDLSEQRASVVSLEYLDAKSLSSYIFNFCSLLLLLPLPLPSGFVVAVI